MLADPHGLQQAYRQEFQQFQARARRQLGALGADYVLLRTDLPLQQTLAQAIAQRMSMRRQ